MNGFYFLYAVNCSGYFLLVLVFILEDSSLGVCRIIAYAHLVNNVFIYFCLSFSYSKSLRRFCGLLVLFVVILPHVIEDTQLSTTLNKTGYNLVFKRHKIEKMPLDAWSDVWKELHQQLVDVNFINNKSIIAEIQPTFIILVVWSMRVFLAYIIYKWLKKLLYPIYKLRDPNDRPKIKRLNLGLSDDNLGSLGQSR